MSSEAGNRTVREPASVLSAQAEKLTGLTRYRIMSEALKGRVRTRVLGGRVFFDRKDLQQIRDDRERSASKTTPLQRSPTPDPKPHHQ
jgi:hypothetical protein